MSPKLGKCDDSGADPINLQYKPEDPIPEQDAPSICVHCREHREMIMQEGGF